MWSTKQLSLYEGIIYVFSPFQQQFDFTVYIFIFQHFHCDLQLLLNMILGNYELRALLRGPTVAILDN